MKANFHLLARWLVIPAIFILIAIQNGCESSGSTGNVPESNTYRLEAVLVNDLNANVVTGDTARVTVLAERNDSLLTTANVTLGNITLVFNRTTFAFDSVYSFDFGPSSLVETGAYGMGLVDSSRFGDTITLVVPDTFSVDFYTGDSTIPNTNGQEIQISWTASANSDGYVVAVVLEDSAYTGFGYSEYVTSQTTQTTIPPDAYRLTTDTAGVAQLDTGWYNIYIYSYSGLPDSLWSEPLLPVPLPSSFGDNVDVPNLAGRIGSVSVTRRVRSQVVSE